MNSKFTSTVCSSRFFVASSFLLFLFALEFCPCSSSSLESLDETMKMCSALLLGCFARLPNLTPVKLSPMPPA